MRNACKLFTRHDPCKPFKLFLERVDRFQLRLVYLGHPLSRYNTNVHLFALENLNQILRRYRELNVVDVAGQ